ncbi:hypothetical protein [Sinorhizobium saheli]|uniref:hypothetical protein n=1 Tax=Sinorhizobium saheli TaxID=36856 RepID=UPI000A058147
MTIEECADDSAKSQPRARMKQRRPGRGSDERLQPPSLQQEFAHGQDQPGRHEQCDEEREWRHSPYGVKELARIGALVDNITQHNDRSIGAEHRNLGPQSSRCGNQEKEASAEPDDLAEALAA